MMFKLLRNVKGQIVILVVFIFIILCAFVGLAIDVGQIYYQRQSLQNAIDLAALASAREVNKNHNQVVSTANNIAKKNGVNVNELTINHPYNGNDYKVELTATRTINLFFLKLLGFHNKTINVRAVAGVNSNLQFTIFSNGTQIPLRLQHVSLIDGDIHSNSDIDIKDKHLTINGIVKSTGTINDPHGITVLSKIENARYREMYTEDIEEYRNKATVFYSSDIQIKEKYYIGKDEIIFVDGSVHLFSRIQGKGTIIATGDIKLSGNSVVFGDTSDEIAFLAGGDIEFSGSKSQFVGLFYTKNGTIKLNMTDSVFYGKLYANSFNINSNKATIIDMDFKNKEILSTILEE